MDHESIELERALHFVLSPQWKVVEWAESNDALRSTRVLNLRRIALHHRSCKSSSLGVGYM